MNKLYFLYTVHRIQLEVLVWGGQFILEKLAKTVSLADQAYEMIRQEITSGKLAPNQDLPEEKLATDLGISRTPLREALRKLALEGLVVLHKGRPATVATFTKEDSLHQMELRRVLETYNIEKIAANPDSKLIRSLKKNVDKQMQAVTANDFPSFIDLDREFHLLLAEKSHNPKLRSIIETVNTGVNRAFLVLSNTLLITSKEAVAEHTLILKALEKQDSQQAKAAMEEHMANIERRFLIYFNEGEEQK